MNAELFFFLLLSAVSVAAAFGMLFSKNAVYSALFLIVNFGTVAVFYLILGAPFLAMAQITVYAGAIMVLFLFVIMLLGAERLRRATTLSWQQPVALGLGAILLVEGMYLVFFRSGTLLFASSVSPDFGSPVAIGDILFNQYLLPFEVTSILLLVAMVGAIVLSRRA